MRHTLKELRDALPNEETQAEGSTSGPTTIPPPPKNQTLPERPIIPSSPGWY